MRLLRRQSDGSFTFYSSRRNVQPPPKYVILSHTWNVDDRLEITYEDIEQQRYLHKTESYEKLRFCAEQAAKDEVHLFWIDTCCINKRDLAETQEAIASMFRWYQGAVKCYAYLTDVMLGSNEQASTSDHQSWLLQFRQSRWFTRGWTLQELLAPTQVEFYSKQHLLLGTKHSMHQTISEITDIPSSALLGKPLTDFSVDERLAWAKHRRTTRKEDAAYCLCGIFGVFLATIYGEEDNAFRRLRDEIRKLESEDSDAEKLRMEQVLAMLPEIQSAAFDSIDRQYDPRCLPGTRVQLLKQIEEWVSAPGGCSIYWLNGMPGHGKSTIALTVARNCQSNDILGASFFFSKNSGIDNRAERLFTTLARQLASNIPVLRRHVCKAVADHTAIASKSLQDQWEQLILGPLTQLHGYTKPIVIVLDALDECSNSKDVEIILRLLATLEHCLDLPLRILFTSRPYSYIRNGFDILPLGNRHECVLHDIAPDTIDADLRLLYEERLTQARTYDKTWPSRLLVNRLVKLSYGLFIWAKIACNYILKSSINAKDRANRLVDGNWRPDEHLDKLYTTVLAETKQFDDSDDEADKDAWRSRWRTIVGSIIVLDSQLSVDGLAKLLDIEEAEVRETLVNLHTVLDVPEPDKKEQKIRLHHPTFREFLLDAKRCTDPEFLIQDVQAHKLLANSCIGLMSRGTLRFNLCNLSSPGSGIEDSERESLVARHLPVELRYACLAWAEHLRQSAITLIDNDYVHRFLMQHTLHWIEAVSILARSSEMTAAMRLYETLLQPERNRSQIPLVRDIRRFMFSYCHQAEDYPLQLYCSALLFIQPSNRVRAQFWHELHPWFPHLKQLQPTGAEARDEFNYCNDVVFTPDGTKVASGSLDNWTRLWDVSGMSADCVFSGHTDKISCVAISPNGHLLASGSDDATVIIYDLRSRETLHRLVGHTTWVNSLAFSSDGTKLVSASSDETFRIWDAQTGAEDKSTSPGLKGITSVSMSPDRASLLLALASAEPVVHLYDVSKDKIVLKLVGHGGPVNTVCFSHDGRLIASGSDDHTARVWDARSGVQTMLLEDHKRKVWTIRFAKTLPLIATGSEDKTMKLWSITDGTLLQTVDTHTSGISAVAFSPDEKLLAAVAFNDEVRFWRLPGVEALGPLPELIDEAHSTILTAEQEEHERAHGGSITCLILSADGQLVASGSEDGVIKIWTKTGDWISSCHGHGSEIVHLAFSQGADLLASTSTDSSVIIWAVRTGEKLHDLQDWKGGARRLLWTLDQRMVGICAADETVKMWNVQNGKLFAALHGSGDTITDFAFSPDCSLAALCTADGIVGLWSLPQGAPRPRLLWMLKAHPTNILHVTFSQDSKLLLTTSSDGSIKLQGIDGSLHRTLRSRGELAIYAGLSDDADYLVSASKGGKITLWDLEDDSIDYEIDTGINIAQVAFSRCGRFIETDRGTIALPQSEYASARSSILLDQISQVVSSQDSVVERPRAVFVTKDWVKLDSQPLLSLPSSHEATRVAVRGQCVILGHKSGALTFAHIKSRA